jgi:hypothetical protein
MARPWHLNNVIGRYDQEGVTVLESKAVQSTNQTILFSISQKSHCNAELVSAIDMFLMGHCLAAPSFFERDANACSWFLATQTGFI